MGIEQKNLIFDVEIHDAQFNHMGRYFVKLSVQSLHTKDYTKIKVKKPPNVDYIIDNEALTDVVRQTADVELCTFRDRKFAFKLPKGIYYLYNLVSFDFFFLKLLLLYLLYLQFY